MRKALIPMLASLALCGLGTLALIASNGRAQASPRKPFMVALLGGDLFRAQTFPLAQPADAARTPPPFTADPKQFCDDRYASEVGRMAYLETRLHLTAAEEPLFARWKNVRLAISKRRAVDCKAYAVSDQERGDPVARMNREEKTLKQGIADLDAERPAFKTLYAALAPDQRQSLAPQPAVMIRGERGPTMPLPHEVDDLPPLPPSAAP